jgi:SET and MYND domain-containing protein
MISEVGFILKGQYEDMQESAVLEGYRCKDNKCDGFLLRDSGMKQKLK